MQHTPKMIVGGDRKMQSEETKSAGEWVGADLALAFSCAQQKNDGGRRQEMQSDKTKSAGGCVDDASGTNVPPLSAEQKRRAIITEYTNEAWRDELFVSPEAAAKEKEADKNLPLWVKVLDSNLLTFVVLPLLLWIGIYIYASPLPQAQAARIAGMWFWGTGILASGCGFFWALASGEYASHRGRRLYFDGYKKLYKTHQSETGLCRFLAGAGLVLSLPFRFGLGSFLAVGIPFWFGLSH